MVTDADEEARLDAVRGLRVTADVADGGLLRLTSLVAGLVGYSSAAITVVDELVQRAITGVGPLAVPELPRTDSFCAVAIQTPGELLVVPDANDDPRFAGGLPNRAGLRAYVGAPLVTRDGAALGALCVFDEQPHEGVNGLGTEQRRVIEALAEAVVLELERSRDIEALAEVARLLARAPDLMTIQAGLTSAVVDVCGAASAALMLRRGDGLDDVDVENDDLAARIGPDDPSVGLLAVAAGEPVFIPDVLEDDFLRRGPAARQGIRAIVAVPVRSGAEEQIVGVLAAQWAHPRARPSDTTMRTLELLADEASVALDRASLLERLAADGRTDALTGIPNRRVLHETLARETARAERIGEELVVAMLDLDRFKAYNDEHGHPAGDHLLRETAVAWAGHMRASDILARYGGEEFALVLPVTEPDDARVLVERLWGLIPEGQTCSAGIAARVPGESADDLLERADRALYRAKATGLGGIAVADERERPDETAA